MKPVFYDYHIHTCLRPIDDGAPSMTPEFVARYFLNRGLSTFGLSPHVHVNADVTALLTFLEQAQNTCDRLQCTMKKGVETECVDVNGTLTLPDSAVDKLDYVIASAEHFNCHGVVQPPKEAKACMQFHMDLLMKLAKHPSVDIIAHPLAGMIQLTADGYMPGYEPITTLDEVTDDWVREFARLARTNHKAVELNGYFTLTYPEKMKAQNRPSYVERYKDIYRILAEEGVMLLASSDAHTPDNLAQFDHAVQWLTDLGVLHEK